MVGWSAHAANRMLQGVFRAPGPVRLAAWSAHGVHRRLQSQSCSEHVCCRPSAHARVERSRSSQNAARNLMSGAPEVCGKRRHLYMLGLRARAGHRGFQQYHAWISKRRPEDVSVVNRRHTAAAITSPRQAQAHGAGADKHSWASATLIWGPKAFSSSAPLSLSKSATCNASEMAQRGGRAGGNEARARIYPVSTLNPKP